jgi:hypothetical protein
MLDDAFPVSGPRIDAEGEVSSQRGHLRPLLPQFSSTSIQRKAQLPKRAGLELERVRPLQSPVSPSAATRNVAFGSAPCLDNVCWDSIGASSEER